MTENSNLPFKDLFNRYVKRVRQHDTYMMRYFIDSVGIINDWKHAIMCNKRTVQVFVCEKHDNLLRFFDFGSTTTDLRSTVLIFARYVTIAGTVLEKNSAKFQISLIQSYFMIPSFVFKIYAPFNKPGRTLFGNL